MLSLNSLIIKSSNSIFLDDIYNILYSNSIDSDPNNYQLFTKDDKFSSIFFDTYENLNFDWAYIDSCERLDDKILLNVYSYNGNLSIWKEKFINKYKEKFKNPPFMSNIKLNIELNIIKSVNFKNYDIEPDWIKTPEEMIPTPKNKKKS